MPSHRVRRDLDTAWTAALRDEHLRRAAKYADALAEAPAGKDGHMHPNRIFAALHEGAASPTRSRSPTAATS